MTRKVQVVVLVVVALMLWLLRRMHAKSSAWQESHRQQQQQQTGPLRFFLLSLMLRLFQEITTYHQHQRAVLPQLRLQCCLASRVYEHQPEQ